MSRSGTVTVRAFAKINLTLRVLGVRADGYHTLRTVLQSIALHDTLVFRTSRSGFRIECDDPSCPMDRANLVWRAADQVWRAARFRGRPRALVTIAKRIPMQAGLGGGSSDAAAAIRALSALWRVDLSPRQQHEIAAGLGADVPFFLKGGTVLGVERGDLLFPLEDHPPAAVTLVLPPFGVATADAYRWYDEAVGVRASSAARPGVAAPTRPARGVRVSPSRLLQRLPETELTNDLQPAVAARHTEIAQAVVALKRLGASHAAMSGSGSAVFGLFESARAAAQAAGELAGRGERTLVSRTIGRSRYRAMSRPA